MGREQRPRHGQRGEHRRRIGRDTPIGFRLALPDPARSAARSRGHPGPPGQPGADRGARVAERAGPLGVPWRKPAGGHRHARWALALSLAQRTRPCGDDRPFGARGREVHRHRLGPGRHRLVTAGVRRRGRRRARPEPGAGRRGARGRRCPGGWAAVRWPGRRAASQPGHTRPTYTGCPSTATWIRG